MEKYKKSIYFIITYFEGEKLRKTTLIDNMNPKLWN